LIAMSTYSLQVTTGIAIASIALGVASTAALATTGLANTGGPFLTAPPACDMPVLPGAAVDVTLTEMPGTMMGPGMGPGMMTLGPSSRYGPGAPAAGYPRPAMQMMSLSLSSTTVPQGQVSFQVVNGGVWIHELAVLPLGPGQNIGQRRIEADNKVDESASLGHVEGSCGADDGDGIAPGAIGWTTITMSPGRYELICNIAGHYRAGMHALLEVTG
jgi:uncharacterized cupredoxin-like copper-binding protein